MITELRDRAGVKIPPLPFVIKSLAIYLFVLIPVNYVVFRLMGRLEWAWLAVPFMALIGAGWVAKTVSLDLGLARNYSEVSLLELQPSYSRGHVTRFTSIYNSLSGKYEIKFDSIDAAAAPLDILRNGKKEFSPCVLHHGYENGLTLTNFSVPSNRTRMFHAEQIVDIGGAFELNQNNVVNRTSVGLINAIVVRKTEDGTIESALVGELEPGSRIRLMWNKKPTYDIIGRLLMPFAVGERLPRGSTRLIGQTAKTLPGMEIVPSTPEQSATNIVIAHLTHPNHERTDGDTNLIPSKKERDKLLLDQGIDPSTVKEISVP